MDSKDLKKCKGWLQNRWPVAGGLLQRKAVTRLAEDLVPEGITLLVEALAAPDRKAKELAEKVLRSLRAAEDRELTDTLCRLAMDDPSGPAAEFCTAAGKRPSNRNEACLFLAVTGQLNAYFQEDGFFQGLHEAYEAADEAMKDRVLDILRSGDRRFEGFFSGPKTPGRCTEKEISVFSEYALRHGNWPRLFSAFLELPLKYGFPLLERLRTSPWEPEDELLKSLYHEVLRENSGEARSHHGTASIPVFEYRPAEDQGAQWATLTGEELFLHLKHLRRQAIERLAANFSPEDIPLLVEALTSPDRYISGLADRTLRSLQGRKDRGSVDVLCRLAMENPSGAAAKICIETGKRPSDPEESCLFLVATGQLDAYFREDPHFQGLSLSYETAGEKIKARVMDVVRSGDRRFEGFFSGPGKLRRCTEEELSIFVEYALRHGNWPRLFKAFLELPLKVGYPLLEHFRTSGWEPDDPELKSVYRSALARSRSEVSPDQKPAAAGSVLDRWLAEGESAYWDGASSRELLAFLQVAPPPEGVAIVAALAKKGATEEVTAAVKSSPHWLVRLAGFMTGIVRYPDGEAERDEVYWVRELAGIGGVLEFQPIRATPADAEKLAAAPPEAFAGRPGALRRVLGLLVRHHAQVGVHEPLLFVDDETAAVVERAD